MTAVAVSNGTSEAEAHIRRFIEDKIGRVEKAYRDADVLLNLYHEREMPTRAVAEKLGCGKATVGRWLDKTGLGARTQSEAQRVERATFNPAKRNGGYEQWTVNEPDGGKVVKVHQLLAVADGADPHEVWADGTHVHHRTNIPWLNIENGVEVLTEEEHRATHQADEWTEENGIPVIKTREVEA